MTINRMIRGVEIKSTPNAEPVEGSDGYSHEVLGQTVLTLAHANALARLHDARRHQSVIEDRIRCAPNGHQRIHENALQAAKIMVDSAERCLQQFENVKQPAQEVNDDE